jgi:hypothetical protein
MLIAGIVAIVLLLLVLGFVAPRLSRHPEGAAHKAFGAGSRAGSKAPGPLGRLLSKPFSSGSKWSGKGARAGRKGRGKLPL